MLGSNTKNMKLSVSDLEEPNAFEGFKDKFKDKDNLKTDFSKAKRDYDQAKELEKVANAASAAKPDGNEGFFGGFNKDKAPKLFDRDAGEERRNRLRDLNRGGASPAARNKKKFMDNFMGIQPEPNVEKKTLPKSGRSLFGSKEKPPGKNQGYLDRIMGKNPDKEKAALQAAEEEPGMFDKPAEKEPGMFDRMMGRDKAPEKEPGMFDNVTGRNKERVPENEPGMFDNMLGRNKDKVPEKVPEKEPGMFDNMLGRNKEKVPEKVPEKEPGMFDNMLGRNKEKVPEKVEEKEPGMFDRMLGRNKEKVPEKVVEEEPEMLDHLIGKHVPEKKVEKEPGMFDKMLGRNKERASEKVVTVPADVKDKEPGMLGKMFGRDKEKAPEKVEEPEKEKPGLFGRYIKSNREAQEKTVIVEKPAEPASDKKGISLLPAFLAAGKGKADKADVTTKPPPKKKSQRRFIARTYISMKTIVFIPLMILILIVAYLAYKYMKAKENSLGSGMSGGMLAEYMDYAFPSQSDWCGHPVKKPKSSRIQPAPLSAFVVTNTTVFSKVGDDYDKMVKIFPEMVISNQSKSSGQTALILCITEPVFILLIDIKENRVELKTMEDKCGASSAFRDAVETDIEKKADKSFKLIATSDTIPFAVTVNVRKMRAEFVLCKAGPQGCLDPIDFMKANFTRLNVNKGITDFALVYSDCANTFKSDPKYLCEVSQTEIQMCWNPKTYAPVTCFKP